MSHLFGIRIDGMEGENIRLATVKERVQYLALLLMMAVWLVVVD